MADIMKKLYFFHNTNYIGYFEMYGPFDLKFVRETPYDELDSASKYMMFWQKELNNKELINSWLEDRVIPEDRPDREDMLAMSQVKSRDPFGILLETNCTSAQDTFWWSEKKDGSWYTNNHWYSLLEQEENKK